MNKTLTIGAGPTSRERMPLVVRALLVGLSVLVCAWAGIEFTRGSDRVATIWLANAVALAFLLRAQTGDWPALLASGYVGNAAANLLSGDAIVQTLGLSACNTVEIALVALPLRRMFGQDLDLVRPRQLGTFLLLAGVLSPALTGLLAAGFLALSATTPLFAVWAKWYPADALGFLIVAPPLLRLRLAEVKALVQRDSRKEAAVWLAILLAILALVFGQSSYPLLFLPMAVLGMIAVRLGAAGSAIGAGLTALTAIVATMHGHGPLMLVPGDIATRILTLQGFLASIVLVQLPLAALLADRVRLDADLRRSEGFLRSVIDASGDCITVLDRAGNLHFISRNGQALMDVDQSGTLLGTPFTSLFPESERPLVTSMFERACSGVPARFKASIVTAKGKPLQVDVLVTEIKGTDGEPDRLVAIARDVTDLHAAEGALLEKTALIEATLESMDQGLIMVDAAGHVPVINRRARELLELPAELPDVRSLREHQRRARRWGKRTGEPLQWTLSADRQSTDLRYERRTADGEVLEIRTVPMEGGGAVQTFMDITHLKRAEDAAREAEALFRGLFDHATDLLFVHRVTPDGTFRLETCNPHAAAVMGVPAEALRGKAPEDMLPPEAAARARADIEETIARGEMRRFEDERVLDAGRAVWEVIHVPLRDPASGRITRIFASARDITHLRAAEFKARKANRSLLLAEQIAQVGHWSLALPENALTWSDEVYRMHGRDPATFTPRVETGIEAYHPDDRAEVARCVAKAIEEGSNFEFSLRLIKSDGCVRDVLSRGMCERDDSGAVTAVFGTIMDVTELRQAERAVAESEARYRLLADNTTDMVSHMDLTGRRLFVSPGSRDLLGYEPHELVGTSPHDMMHPDDAAGVAAVFADLAAGRTDRGVSINRLRHKNEAWIWVEASLRLLRDDKGEPQSLVAAIRDVTERQKQADEILAAKEIAELAKVRADHASQAKTDFLAAMSHEIRTPLNAIIGFTGLMLDSASLTPDGRRHAELIQSSGSALLTVVNDILDFSKIEAGAVELERIPFSPLALAENCAAIMQGAANEKHLELRTDLDSGLPPGLVGDEARLRQILLNLLSNAVKFTRAGHVALSVSHKGSGQDGERLRFAVTDTGIGIPKDKQERLFQRFSQVDGSIQRDYGGTGLGLAISKRLIEMMGGEIGVSSEESRGSTFWFTLTLPRGTLANTRIAAEPPASRKCGRLLLVEDVEINQELARIVLEAAGHAVDVVGDGASAVAAVRDESNHYDLVLMDVQMPDMDGMTATRLIRDLDSPRSRIPIIAMTANVLPDQVSRFKAAGMDDHVGKPFKRGDLYAAIDRWLAEPVVARRSAEAVDQAGATCVDRETLDDLVRLLGQEVVAGFLGDLEREFDSRFDRATSTATEDRLSLLRDARAVMPAAGMLGFQEFARLCQNLDDDELDEAEFELRLADMMTARDAVIRDIAALEPALRALAAE